MPDEDKNFSGALGLDFRKRWRHVKTIYKSSFIYEYSSSALQTVNQILTSKGLSRSETYDLLNS